MPIKKIHLYFILFFFFSLSIQGQWQISKEDLAKAGIEHSSFKMAILTTKGNLAIGYEYLDLEHRKKGEIYALHLIYLKPNNAFEVKSVVLPFTFLVGIGLIQNEKKAIIVGNYGTKIIILDLKTLEIKTIFEYQPKQPGFRTGTLVVGFKNKVYLSGYFYDKDQYWLGDYVAELIVSEDTNNIEFYKKINLQDAYSQIGGQPYIYQLISGNMAYFGIPRQRDSKNRPQMDLYFYKNKKVEKIASGLTIGAFAGTEDVVFYTVFKNSWEAYIQSIDGKWKHNISQKNIPYTYPFISDNSETIVYCTIDIYVQTMDIYYAQKKDKYEPKFLKTMPIGAMKLSGDGTTYLHIGPEYIEIDTFANQEKLQQEQAEKEQAEKELDLEENKKDE